jgi:hypothetical protein
MSIIIKTINNHSATPRASKPQEMTDNRLMAEHKKSGQPVKVVRSCAT